MKEIEKKTSFYYYNNKFRCRLYLRRFTLKIN